MFDKSRTDHAARIATALNLVDRIAGRCPDLAVTWASMLLYFIPRGSAVETAAVGCVADNLPAAYSLDPKAAHDAAVMVHLWVHDRGLRRWVQSRLYDAAPMLQPGPWGLRPPGVREISSLHKRSQAPWDRWADQLGDLKHRLLHPPGPHDVTIPGSNWDDDPPADGPAGP